MKIELPIESERLVIRPLELADAADLGEPEEWIREKIDRFERDGGMSLWAAVERESGRAVGLAGLQWEEIDGRRELDLGCVVATDAQQRGYGTEASVADPGSRLRRRLRADHGDDRPGQRAGPARPREARVHARGRYDLRGPSIRLLRQSRAMKVTFVKKGSQRYAVEVRRDRYPDLWCGTIGYDDWLPHDLLHFVAEAEYGLERRRLRRSRGGRERADLPADRQDARREDVAQAANQPHATRRRPALGAARVGAPAGLAEEDARSGASAAARRPGEALARAAARRLAHARVAAAGGTKKPPAAGAPPSGCRTTALASGRWQPPSRKCDVSARSPPGEVAGS